MSTPLGPGSDLNVVADALTAGERDALRADTPGIDHAYHFNSAGAALPSATMLATVINHLQLEARVGGYEAAEAALPRLRAVYERAARLVGGEPEDLALVESATVAWQRAVDALRLGPGDRVLASSSSYVSSALNLLELCRSRGVELEILPTDSAGQVDLEALRRALRGRVRLLTVAHVPTSSGLVEPVAEIGALARAAGVPFLLDATQSLGQLPVNAVAIGADIVVGTGRKFLRGPRGTGLLYANHAFREAFPPLAPDVRGADWQAAERFELDPGARRYETWEASHALRLGLGVALAATLELGVPRIQQHLGARAEQLRTGLAAIPAIRVTDPPASPSGIVTFVRNGEDPRVTVTTLRAAGFNLVPVPAGHGQWDLGRRGLAAVVRASVHVYTDAADVAALLAELGD